MIRIGSAEVELFVPTEDFQLVHQLLHVYSHYVYEGVGLRQLMDLYFAQDVAKVRAECSHDPLRLPGRDLRPVVSTSHRNVAQKYRTEI